MTTTALTGLDLLVALHAARLALLGRLDVEADWPSGADVVTILNVDRTRRIAVAERFVYRALSLAEVWQNVEIDDMDTFITIVGAIHGAECSACEGCVRPAWDDDGYHVRGHGFICGDCYSRSYFTCGRCEDIYHDDDSNTVGDETWCDRCRDRAAVWCEHCEQYDTEGHDHDDSCGCEAPHRRFAFPANGDGTVPNDERLAVTLPGGVIDSVGLSSITTTVWNSLSGDDRVRTPIWVLRDLIDAIGPEWQTSKGNFTKRLSKAMHGAGVKVAPAIISEVGNIARAHSSTATEWEVEFTRDLNQSADFFYHEDSCWWQSHAASRCALKNWGGLGMRSFNASGYLTGRAWIQPLGTDLQPTHRTEDAHAYLVYNGYGDLGDYTPARIVAHLTGRTYRLGRVGLSLGPQYVNGESGYLVADQATCEAVESITVSRDEHNRLDANTIHTSNPEVAA